MDSIPNPKHKESVSALNNLVFGVVVGLLTPISFSPLIALFIKWRMKNIKSLEHIMNEIFQSPDQLSSFVCLSVLINLPLFILFYYRKLDRSNKGMLLSTLLFCIFVFILKLI